MATLICTIELDKEKGLTIKVEDPQGKLSQTVTIDGKAITLEVKSDSDTSTVVQKPDGVTITCKAFTVDADTLTLKSKEASEWTSKKTLALKSDKDMTLTSGAKLTQEAKEDASLSSGATVEVKAKEALTLEGKEAQLTGTSGDITMEGANLKMSGKAEVEIKAPTIKATATGQLSLEATGPAELKGATTTVSGSPVNLG